MRAVWLVGLWLWGCGDTVVAPTPASGPPVVLLVGTWEYEAVERGTRQRFVFVFADSTYRFTIYLLEDVPPLRANAMRWDEAGVYVINGCDWNRHCHGAGQTLTGRGYSFQAQEWQKPEAVIYWTLEYSPLPGGMDINGRRFRKVADELDR